MTTGMMRCPTTTSARPAARKAAALSARKAPAPMRRNTTAYGLFGGDNAGKKGSGNTDASPVDADNSPARQKMKADYKAKENAADGAREPSGGQGILSKVTDFFRTKPDTAPLGDNAGKAGSGNTQIPTKASDPPNRKKMKEAFKAKEDAQDGKR